MSAGNKQVKITADLLARALHELDELNCDYAVVIHGLDHVFTNIKPYYAIQLMRDAVEVYDRNRDKELEYKAEQNAEKNGWRKDGDE